jgi:hypothetical protein
MPKQAPAQEFLPADDDADVCKNCGNIYRIVWLKTGEDYNDFGQRYCPYCGLLTNEW